MNPKKPVASRSGEKGSSAEEPRPEALLAGQNEALEMIAGDAPLADVLDYLTRFIESQADDLLCSVLVLEGDRLRHGAAPSLPEAYNAIVDGTVIGPMVGSCGTAAFTGRRVVAVDIETDPRWAPFPTAVKIALEAGLRGCWSTPIVASGGAVLGTFAIYCRAHLAPRAGQLRLVALATHIAGIAIERAAVRRELAEREAQLVEAAQRKDEMLAVLGHELRNPLSPIVTALALMRTHEHEPTSVARYREIVERQVRHLSRLVDDLLDISRITHGKITLQRERTTVAAAIQGAVEATRAVIDERRHALTVTLPDDDLLAVDADPVRIAQVFSNLLCNAAKYTPPGGHIAVHAARDGEDVVVRVRDDGMGVPTEMRDHVFDLFVQADGARTNAQGGLGIGLSLVQRLVELHGGRVALNSEGPGQGTEVTVRLPRAKAVGEARRPAPAAPIGCARSRKVLVVDDNLDAAESLAEALRDCGHEVRVDHDGPGALTTADAWLPDVALVDIGLPGMDGYQVARCLRTAHPKTALRLVALTGYGQESDQRRAKEAGFDAHLVKPADLDRIAALIAA